MTPEQQAYFENNTQKPANVITHGTFKFSHPDFSEDILLVAVKEGTGYDNDDAYIFEGVTYRPIPNLSLIHI